MNPDTQITGIKSILENQTIKEILVKNEELEKKILDIEKQLEEKEVNKELEILNEIKNIITGGKNELHI